MLIESTKNETIKKARFLAERKARLETGTHLVEGEKLVMEAINSGEQIVEAFVEPDNEVMINTLTNTGAKIILVSHSVMKSLATTVEPQSVCAVVKTRELTPPVEYPNGLIIALDEVQDPGNLGTIIRTADAFGASGVLLSKGCADPYAPKVIRSTMGSIYHLPIWNGDLVQQLSVLKEKGFDFICGHLNGSEQLPSINKEAVVLVIGNEGHGVSDKVADMCNKYRLTMYGSAESLNASIAAGILTYEIAKYIRNS